MLAKLQLSFMSWQINYKTGGNLQVVHHDVASGAVVHTSAVMGTGLDGSHPAHLRGAHAERRQHRLVSRATTCPGRPTPSTSTGPGPDVRPSAPRPSVQVGAPGVNSSVAIGHVTVESAVTSIFDFVTQINAYQGESSVTRAYRLAGEEGYPLYLYGPDH
jgi:hypothetical protein